MLDEQLQSPNHSATLSDSYAWEERRIDEEAMQKIRDEHLLLEEVMDYRTYC